jgi:hypothetical protein
MGSWVHGFMGSWVHEFMGSWVHGFMGSWVHGFMRCRPAEERRRARRWSENDAKDEKPFTFTGTCTFTFATVAA